MAIFLHKSKFTCAALRFGHFILQEIKITSLEIILKSRSVWQTLKILRWQTNLKDINFILLTYYQFQSGDEVLELQFDQ